MPVSASHSIPASRTAGASQPQPAAARQSSGPAARSGGTALVLGYRGVSELIARRLEAEGFRAVLLDPRHQPLPSLANPERSAKLRAILEQGIEASSEREPRVLHPGVGTWAERPELVTIGQELGYTVLTPPIKTLAAVSNKLNLLLHAERFGVPNLLISPDPVNSIREIEQLAGLPGSSSPRFPLILKDVHGGGSRGRQAFLDSEDLARRLPLWMEQLRLNFGEVIVFAERHLEGARAVAVPFARFTDGRIELFAMVDGSLQSRQRRIVEFCPAPSLDDSVRRQLDRWTSQLAESVGFVGVGAAEFLVDGNRAFLTDLAGSLTTSFPLWERVTGTHAVSWQLATQLGSPDPAVEPSRSWGAGVSLRLFAEDSFLHLPQPGAIREISEKREWSFPAAEAEFLPGYAAGDEVAPRDSGLLGAVYAGGQDRKLAVTVARGVLEEIWIAGSLQTNERFLGEILEHPWVKEGVFHAGFVEEEFVPALRPPGEMARLFATVLSVDPRVRADAEARWAVGDQAVQAQPELLKWIGEPERWEAQGLPGVSGALTLEDGRRARVCAYPVREGRWVVRIGSWSYLVRRLPALPAPGVKPTTPRPHKVRALVSGRVHSILFRAGAVAPAHEPLLVIESLGILVPHALPLPAKILRWSLQAEDAVHAGDELADIEVKPAGS